MNTSVCPECARTGPEDAVFCAFCGIKLADYIPEPGLSVPPVPEPVAAVQAGPAPVITLAEEKASGLEVIPAKEKSPEADSSSTQTPAIPEGWVMHTNPWCGFTVAHPPGWEVVVNGGSISIREDHAGLCGAVIWPFRQPTPITPRQAVDQLLALARQVDPRLLAWEGVPTGQPDPSRLTFRTRGFRYGQALEGDYTVMVDGYNNILSGFEAPPGLITTRAPILSQILSTFRTTDLMPRQQVREPAEGAFEALIPPGWNYQALVNRNNLGGAATTSFVAGRDPQNLVCAAVPGLLWQFTEGLEGLFGGLSGGQSLSYMPAPAFCGNWLAHTMRQRQAGFTILEIQDRPDLNMAQVLELGQAGYSTASMDLSAAVMVTGYNEAGVRLIQKSAVYVMRPKTAGLMFGGGSWSASLQNYYRVPEAEFAAWEPVLSGILDSIRANPAWIQGERALSQNYIAYSQQDIIRRTGQISQTISETNDIITGGYWERQQVYDRLSHDRSNATLGYQDMTDNSGQLYSVPSGYDRYWVDNLGYLYTGNWYTTPDYNWKPLEPAR